MSSWDDPSIVLSAVAAGATVIYTGLTAFILKATSRNTEATKNILEAAYRPYIGVIEVEIQVGEYHGAQMGVRVTVKNTGSVPGRRIEVEIELKPPGGGESGIGKRSSIALMPDQTMVATPPIPKDLEHFVNPGGIEVKVEVSYQGITEKQYCSHATYIHGGMLKGFTMSTSHFE